MREKKSAAKDEQIHFKNIFVRNSIPSVKRVFNTRLACKYRAGGVEKRKRKSNSILFVIYFADNEFILSDNSHNSLNETDTLHS